MRRLELSGGAAFLLANLAGAVGFLWPLFAAFPGGSLPAAGRGLDAPVLVALLVPLLIVVALREATGGGGAAMADARLIALLGVLVAVNAFLRIPKGPSGEGLVFVLPILAGWFVGARFAFLLGAFTMLVSALITGGVGPWLPFQMFALGWVGAGAGLLRRAVGGRAPVVSLAAYAYASSLAYGFTMTLWFWPFLGREGEVFFVAGGGLADAVSRYWGFYLLTSLPWDTGRALLTNVPLVAILARPVGTLLTRAKDRLSPELEPTPPQPWMPHSVLVEPSQRPARSSSPGETGRVQGAQPIEG